MTETPTGPLSQPSPSTQALGQSEAAAPLPPVPGYQAAGYSAPEPAPAAPAAPALDLPPIELPSDAPSGYQAPTPAAEPVTPTYAPGYTGYTPPATAAPTAYAVPEYGQTTPAPAYAPYPGQAAAPYAGYSGQAVAPYQPAGYPAAAYTSAPKSKMAAGLLGIFLGCLGIHNFYLGYTGRAVAQLLISVLSLGFLAVVSGIWGLIEGILILTAQPGTPRSLDAKGVPLTQ
ncbi:MAG: TM2 domain-containing protein [Propionibacteriaceae bacterium]|jgi:TM2 domain-containing membrane protein YozV|nr:TM2 domain-containing protein [Propionibacteriaceae bacterium]